MPETIPAMIGLFIQTLDAMGLLLPLQAGVVIIVAIVIYDRFSNRG